MNNFNKYFTLLALIIGSFLGFLLLAVALFFILKLFSVTLFHIPGTDKVYQFFIVVIPYTVFFFGYHYMHKKIPLSTRRFSRIAGRVLMVTGSIICLATLVFALLDYLSVKGEWMTLYKQNTQYGLIAQIFLLFFTALIVATGDAKEKDWMDKVADQ
ncbi:MAG TPA: hypothetical protein PKA46_04860 [Ferruginibacter sp.]|nr:hypothetical protein [Ferruginibacter sp.]